MDQMFTFEYMIPIEYDFECKICVYIVSVFSRDFDDIAS